MYKIAYKMSVGTRAFKMALNLLFDIIIKSENSDQKKGSIIIPKTIFSNVE